MSETLKLSKYASMPHKASAQGSWGLEAASSKVLLTSAARKGVLPFTASSQNCTWAAVQAAKAGRCHASMRR